MYCWGVLPCLSFADLNMSGNLGGGPGVGVTDGVMVRVGVGGTIVKVGEIVTVEVLMFAKGD